MLCLADARLDCALGRVASDARRLIRVRRAIIRSGPWLELRELSAVVGAFLNADPIIAQQVNFQVAERITESVGGIGITGGGRGRRGGER